MEKPPRKKHQLVFILLEVQNIRCLHSPVWVKAVGVLPCLDCRSRQTAQTELFHFLLSTLHSHVFNAVAWGRKPQPQATYAWSYSFKKAVIGEKMEVPITTIQQQLSEVQSDNSVVRGLYKPHPRVFLCTNASVHFNVQQNMLFWAL